MAAEASRRTVASLAALIWDVLVFTIPLIEVPPMEKTPAVTITTKVIISVYSIKS